MSSAPLEDHDDGGGGGAAPPSRRRQHGVTYVSGAEGNENEVANEGSGDHVAVPVRGGGARGMANISAEDALVPPPDRARGAASSARGAAIGSSASGEEERETDEEEQEQDPDASLPWRQWMQDLGRKWAIQKRPSESTHFSKQFFCLVFSHVGLLRYM